MKRIVTLGAVLLLAGCSLLPFGKDDEPTPTATAEESDEAQASAVYDQDINWKDCDGFECGTVQVPVDWEDPDGATFSGPQAFSRGGRRRANGLIAHQPRWPRGQRH